MKMKKYNASSIAEAMKQIRADLGEDAVILNSKVVVTKKYFGLIKNKSYEVVAGYDQLEKKPSILSSLSDIAPVAPIVKNESLNFQKQQSFSHVESPYTPHADNSLLPENLIKEIADLKSIMQSMQRMSTQAQYPDELLPFVDSLKQQELGEELITAISDELFMHYKNDETNLQWSKMQQITRNFLNEQLKYIPISGLSYEKIY